VQVKPVPDTSTAAAFVPLDAVEAVDSPIVVLLVRQMIFSYLLPSGKRLLFPHRAKAKQAQLARYLNGIHMRRTLIDHKGINFALLQVCCRFRAEALTTLIRLNTILILVLEDIDVQRTSFSSLRSYYWTHVPNIAVKDDYPQSSGVHLSQVKSVNDRWNPNSTLIPRQSPQKTRTCQ
jgi:hypothetical protein